MVFPLVLDTSSASIARAARCLREGGLVAFPTETVYGLGAHALDPAAVRRLFAAKGRPSTDPLIVHVLSADDVAPLTRSGAADATVRALTERFWPGPLTLVLPRSPRVPDEVTAGLETVAVRAPAHPVARALLAAAAVPVAAPSANLFSRPSPTRAEHVLQDLEGRIDFVIDGGPTTVGVESTVLDISGGTPTILRPGAVTIEMLRELLPDVREREPRMAEGPMPSPGLLPTHYAPRAPLTLYEGAGARAALARAAADAVRRGARIGIAAPTECLDGLPAGARIADLGPAADPGRVAGRLYAALRELDAAGVDAIHAIGVPDATGLGRAIQDRLRRAASGRIIQT